MQYEDLEIKVEAGQGREFPVSVVRSPAGGEPHETMYFPFDDLELANNLLILKNVLLRSGGNYRRDLSPEEKQVQAFGRNLFETLMVGGIRRCYEISRHKTEQEGKGLRLKLRIQSPQMAALPWEFLFDPQRNEYLVLSNATPVIRYLELPYSIPLQTVTLPIRILAMIASPQGLQQINIQREKQRIELALSKLKNNKIIELKWLEGQTWRNLQQAMRSGPWNIFHFIGHGGFDRYSEEGVIILADDDEQPYRLNATRFARLLGDHRSLRLVLLNSCEGARSSGQDTFSSTASILVQRGLPAVLAMQYEITDQAAIEFARAFYEALTDDWPIDSAVAEARKAISIGVNNTIEWGTPVLYTHHADGVIFRISRGLTSTLLTQSIAPTSGTRNDKLLEDATSEPEQKTSAISQSLSESAPSLMEPTSHSKVSQGEAETRAMHTVTTEQLSTSPPISSTTPMQQTNAASKLPWEIGCGWAVLIYVGLAMITMLIARAITQSTEQAVNYYIPGSFVALLVSIGFYFYYRNRKKQL